MMLLGKAEKMRMEVRAHQREVFIMVLGLLTANPQILRENGSQIFGHFIHSDGIKDIFHSQ